MGVCESVAVENRAEVLNNQPGCSIVKCDAETNNNIANIDRIQSSKVCVFVCDITYALRDERVCGGAKRYWEWPMRKSNNNHVLHLVGS